MNTYFEVSFDGLWYDLFYNLALLVTLFVLIYEGYRRKFPILKWILLILITRMLFIAGTKIITFSNADWNYLFTNWQLPEVDGRSLLGGLLFGSVGLVGGYYFLKFKHNISDAFALIIPLGLSIQRIGCFVTGCCFGKVCNLPWAVKYPVNTLPHYHQFNDNLLTYNDTLSLPVHPVQLYEIIGLIIVLFILIKAGKRLKQTGSLFILSLILLFVVRIIIEFFRDPNAHTIGGMVIGWFNTTQLVLMPVCLLLILYLIKKEKKPNIVSDTVADSEISFLPAMLILSLIFTVFWSLRSWFDLPELIAIWVTLITAMLIAAYQFITQPVVTPIYRLYIAALILPLFLTSQTIPGNNEQDSLKIQKYKTIRIGYGSGDYDNYHTIGYGTGCDRVSNTEYFKQKYDLVGAAFEITELRPENEIVRYGLQTVIGSHTELRISDKKETKTDLFSINPYVKYDTKWIGIGGGVHLGNISYIYENLNQDGNEFPESGSNIVPVYPQVYFRLGPQKWFFVDYHMADNFPSALPGFRHQIGIGTGFGLNNGTNVRLGFNSNDITYLSGYFPIKNKIELQPMLLWGRSPIDDAKNYQFSIGIGYRFGFK